MSLKNKPTAAAWALLALAMLAPVGCTTSRSHVYLLGLHVRSGAENEGRASLPADGFRPSDGEFVSYVW